MTDYDALVKRLRDACESKGEKRCNYGVGYYWNLCEEAADALAVAQASEGRLRDALNETAFLLGAWEAIAHIEYCRFCSYSRGWIAKHGHGNTCPLYEDAALQQGAIAQQTQEKP